jgi:Caspase domain
MRKALIVGIDEYQHANSLQGCVNDANAVIQVLERHQDGSTNFVQPKVLLGTKQHPLERSELRAAIQELFNGAPEIALLYFAGHGHIETAGGYLATSEVRTGDEGVNLSEIVTWANQSKATNRIVLLDCCHSGAFGNHPGTTVAELAQGTTVLTETTDEQYATEAKGSGLFTTLLVDALRGGAANLVGDVTPGSVYAHIDQSLGPWDQRPVFKTNTTTFVSLRKTAPSIELSELRRLAVLFPQAEYRFPLDPTFEPERHAADTDTPAPVPANTATFALLQKFNRAGLVVPVDAPHMWHAAMQSKSCGLTSLGKHYRRLGEQKRI